MTFTRLTSKDNPLLKQVRLVAHQTRRAPHALVLAEGIRAVEEAVAAGRNLQAVLVIEDRDFSSRQTLLIEVLARRGARIYHVPERLFSSISDVQTSQGILALAEVPLVSLAGFVLPPNPLILCACGLQDPGNLGTLVRTAAAAGACLVCTMTGTVSARMPKTIRATAGAFFRIPVIEHLQPAAFFSFCRTRAIVPFLADVRGRQPYDLADYRRPCAILVGNEARGVDWPPGAEIQTVCIPMAPGTESLNVGTAGALVMYEAFRQRTPWSNL